MSNFFFKFGEEAFTNRISIYVILLLCCILQLSRSNDNVSHFILFCCICRMIKRCGESTDSFYFMNIGINEEEKGFVI